MAEATVNQIRAEQLIEELFSDPELGPKLHARAQKKFGDIRPHPADVVSKTLVECVHASANSRCALRGQSPCTKAKA